MSWTFLPCRHRNGVFARAACRFDLAYEAKLVVGVNNREQCPRHLPCEMNEQNSGINGIMKSIVQSQINGDLSAQKSGPGLDGTTVQDAGAVVSDGAMTNTVDPNNVHVNTVQRNEITSEAASAFFQTIMNTNQATGEIHAESETSSGEGQGSLEAQYALPNLHGISSALQHNGDIQTQQTHNYVLNSLNPQPEQGQALTGQALTGVDQNFGNPINSESANNLQSLFINQNPNSDLHIITDNSLNSGSAHIGNLPTFEGLAQVNSKPTDSPEFISDKPPNFEQLLSDQKLSDSVRPSQTISSPEFHSACSPTSSSNSPYTESNGQDTSSFMDHTSQGLGYTEMTPISVDTSTQSSLITRSEKLVLVDSPLASAHVDRQENNIEWGVTKLDDHELEQIGKPKMMKIGHESDVPSSVLSPSVERVFDVESAMQGVTSEFTFHKFGQGDADQGFFQFGTEKKEVDGPSSPPITFKTPHPPSFGARKREQARRSREPILSQQFPSRYQSYELKILSQPEEQHRARYLTEGSRGSVKNRGGQGYPAVKLNGYSGEATLQVFVGNDSGRVRPHGFYQACKVCGKNSTPCTERDIDGTTVIEIDLKSSNEMTASIDCVGILKLRNADVEQRIGIAKAKKKSTKARMVFRVTFQKPCGSPQVLQVSSAPILCTQPIGQPEICKMSLKESLVSGGEELYIIGKNFLRGTRIYFRTLDDDDKIVWEKEGVIDKDYFQTTHLIVTVPEYNQPLQPGMTVNCLLVAHSGGKLSDPQTFTYRAEDKKVPVKQEIPMDTSEESRKRNYPFVAPEALELNQQIQQASKNSDMFQLPPAVMTGVMQQQNNSNVTLAEIADVGLQSEPKSYQQQPSQLTDTGNNTEQMNMNPVDYSMNTNVFNTDTIGNSQSQVWDSKPLDASKGYTNMESDTNESLFPMNTDESYPNQTYESSLNRIKSPRLSVDTYQTDHGLQSSMYSGETVDLTSSSGISTSESNMLSQILQNLEGSDSMLGSSNENMANPSVDQVGNQSSGSLYSSGPNNTGSSKMEDQTCSLLKEALTCPANSLQDFSKYSHVANSNIAGGQTSVQQSCDSEMKEVDSDMGSSKETMNPTMTLSPNTVDSYNSTVFSPEQVVPSPSAEAVLQSSYNQQPDLTSRSMPTPSAVSISTVFSTPGLINNSSNTNTPNMVNNQLSQLFPNVVNASQLQTSLQNANQLQTSLQNASQLQTSLQNASQLQTSLQNANHLQAQLQNASIQSGSQLAGSQTVTVSSSFAGSQQSPQIFHNQTASFQLNQLQAQGHLSQSSQSIVMNLASQGSNSASGTTLSDIQQLLQQSVHQSVQQQPLISQQMGANQIGVLNKVETKIVPSPQAELQAQPAFPSQPNFNGGGSTNVALQQPIQTNQQQVQQQQQQQPSPQPAQQPPSPGGSAPSVNTSPLGPQIIICNPGAQQASQPTPGFGAPSIVIMPAQNGHNNQVESLLRSILGSMMGQPQQQQQQTQQQPTNQQ